MHRRRASYCRIMRLATRIKRGEAFLLFLGVVTFAWTLSAPLQAFFQGDHVPRIRTESELVLVDVVIQDRSGFVFDLRLDEIRLFEDGKRQKIRIFRLEQGTASGDGTRREESSKDLTHVPERLAATEEGYFLFPPYYLLGYVPTTAREEGRVHRIKLRVRRKGLHVLHRNGYIDPKASAYANADLEDAFSYPDRYVDFPFELSVRQEDGKLAVQMMIPSKALIFQKVRRRWNRFTTAGRRHRCDLEIFAVSLDEAGRRMGDGFLFAKNVDLDFDDAGLAEFRKYDSFGPSVEAQLPEGATTMVVVLRQKPSGKLSATTYQIRTEQK